MRRVQTGGLLPWMVILAVLITGCAAPSGELAREARADMVTVTVATAHVATPTAGGLPLPAHSVASPAGVSPAGSTSSPTPARTPTPTPTHTPATLSTDEQPAPSPTPSLTATATATAPATATATAVTSPAPTPVAAAVDLATTGVLVYKGQFCGICHQLGAAGTGGLFGPTHDGIGTTAEGRVSEPGYSGVATTAEEYILESIVDPKAFIVPGYGITSHPMPAYDFLDEEQILALVQMLLAQE